MYYLIYIMIYLKTNTMTINSNRTKHIPIIGIIQARENIILGTLE